jgi:CBS-domain-containing membrane protein
MQVHPPGGATALIAVTSPPAVRLKGFYIVMPVLSGSLILLLVALIVNNLRRHVSFPTKSSALLTRDELTDNKQEAVQVRFLMVWISELLCISTKALPLAGLCTVPF